MSIPKYSAKERLSYIQDYQDSELPLVTYCRKMEIPKSTFKRWCMLYKSQGASGLLDQTTRNFYSSQFKLKVVKEYLSGKYSYEDLVIRHKLRGPSQAADWVSTYNRTKHLGDTPSRKQVRSMTTRKTTVEERRKVVDYALAHNKDYLGTARKFNLSYQRVYNWVHKVELGGYAALEDNRGHRRDRKDLSEADELRLQLRESQARVKAYEMEDEFLKKLKEHVRRWQDDHK